MTSKQKVSVDEVSLNVVGVSIKAVQIGKKQMTLSVFRQLPNYAIWLPNTRAAQSGRIWGIVNYFWDGCGCTWYRPQNEDERGGDRQVRPNGKREHIVWESNGHLLRSCLTLEQGESNYDGHSPDNTYCYMQYKKPDRKLEAAWNDFYFDRVNDAEQLFIAV